MRIFAIAFTLLSAPRLFAQDIDQIINPAAVERTEKVLSSDEMRGRATFTPDIDRAADYIESRFKAAGLVPWNGTSFRQPFSLIRATLISAKGTLDGNPIPEGQIITLSSKSDLSIDDNSGYEKYTIKAGSDLRLEARKYIREKKNLLVFVDTSFSRTFPNLTRYTRQQFKSDHSVVFILTSATPAHYALHIQQNIEESKLTNIVGVLPGSTKKEEVIFSGHYDHLGVGKPNAAGDSIYNGANDDASGTTAVIMLADYFAKKKHNTRTIIFAAFTAEEIGGFGSQYFSEQYDPSEVAAMFNIEMIGTESKWGTNSAYITGYEKSDMGQILQKNLTGSGFTFYPDPYTDQQLFYRSDNATLARQGVPAHTISTSKMDSEKFYHTQGDEIGTLDMSNMARIIKSIAISSTSIIAGKDTPSRVDTKMLQ